MSYLEADHCATGIPFVEFRIFGGLGIGSKEVFLEVRVWILDSMTGLYFRLPINTGVALWRLYGCM